MNVGILGATGVWELRSQPAFDLSFDVSAQPNSAQAEGSSTPAPRPYQYDWGYNCEPMTNQILRFVR